MCAFVLIALEPGKEGEDDYKGDSKFAAHLKTQQSSSAHTRSRTLKEQREYLPAFACREDLMRTIRDNQGTSAISYTYEYVLIVLLQ